MSKRTFTKQFMLDTLDDQSDIVRDELWDIRRWTVTHELIFKHEGKLYRTYYSRGSTEYQDEMPWEYVTEVECDEVVESLVPGYVKLGERIIRPRI